MRPSILAPVVVFTLIALVGCAAAEPEPARPTSGAAWGGAVVPYSEDMIITGGLAAEAGDEGVDVLDITPGDPFRLDAIYTNSTGLAQPDLNLWFRFDAALGVEPDDISLDHLNGEGELPVTDEGLTGFESYWGSSIGAIDDGNGVHVLATFVAPPNSADCGPVDRIIWFGFYDTLTGDRTAKKTTARVAGMECPEPTPTAG